MKQQSIKDLILLKKIDIINTREQIQEDIITYAAVSTVPTKEVDALCQIVIDNFYKHLGVGRSFTFTTARGRGERIV
jgi:hypothetical protein